MTTKTITNIKELKAEIAQVRQLDFIQKQAIQKDIEKIKDLFDPVTDFIDTTRSGIKKVKGLFGKADSNDPETKINHTNIAGMLKSGVSFLIPFLANKLIFRGNGSLIKSAATYFAVNFLSNKAENNTDEIVDKVSSFVNNFMSKRKNKVVDEYKFDE